MLRSFDNLLDCHTISPWKIRAVAKDAVDFRGRHLLKTRVFGGPVSSGELGVAAIWIIG
jgi:hypothetical protein